jgi:hypothetical protein
LSKYPVYELVDRSLPARIAAAGFFARAITRAPSMSAASSVRVVETWAWQTNPRSLQRNGHFD